MLEATLSGDRATAAVPAPMTKTVAPNAKRFRTLRCMVKTLA